MGQYAQRPGRWPFASSLVERSWTGRQTFTLAICVVDAEEYEVANDREAAVDVEVLADAGWSGNECGSG